MELEGRFINSSFLFNQPFRCCKHHLFGKSFQYTFISFKNTAGLCIKTPLCGVSSGLFLSPMESAVILVGHWVLSWRAHILTCGIF